MKFLSTTRKIAALGACAFAFTGIGLAAQTASAQTAPPHHLNMIQRHPTMTALAAAAATHHALKVKAMHDKMMGRHLNFAERHPTMSAMGAAALTHHEIKAHTPH